MGSFLNAFAKRARRANLGEIAYAHDLIEAFLGMMSSLPRSVFSVTGRIRFNIAVFEATFRVLCERAYASKSLEIPKVEERRFEVLRKDDAFVRATRFSTGQAANVKVRYERIKQALLS